MRLDWQRVSLESIQHIGSTRLTIVTHPVNGICPAMARSTQTALPATLQLLIWKGFLEPLFMNREFCI